MAYRQTCVQDQISVGAGIPVCRWAKAKAALFLMCVLLLQLGCREEPQEPSASPTEPQQIKQPNEAPVDTSSEGGKEKSVELVEPAVIQETPTPLSDALPDRFTDRMIFPALAASDDPEYRREAEHVFDMVLVPGDPEKGIKPFYLSKTEVRLAMFYPWAMGYGMGWNDLEVKRRAGFYPSQYAMLFSEDNWLYDKQYPALAMSRTAAVQYCKTLSEQTGRTYRLPTEKEWEHALELGGGVPKGKEPLLKIAHLATDENDQDEPPFRRVPARVGSLAADRLGLHDLLGNAAEWVTGTGKDRVVRGGYFELPFDEMKADWRAVEDIKVWNETYPQLPLPTGLYRDFPYTGIRLACDADQAPEAPPITP